MKRYIILIICLFISACYFNLLQLPNRIVTGGIAGLSIILNNLIGIEPSLIILLISLSLLIVGTITLGFSKTSGAMVSSIVYPFLVDITENIDTIIELNINNLFIISIILGVLFGITTGLVYKVGFSNGGLSILSEIISKYTKVSLSKIIFTLNFIIVIIGSFTFGIKMLLYATLILIINSIVIDIILKK